MAIDVILPALGMSQDTGKIVQWLKAEGERVAKGEPLAEIETDKATVEIEAPADGVLAHVSAAAGDDVPVGQVIAAILAPGEVSTGNAAQGQEQQRSQDFSRETATRPGPVISTAPARPSQDSATPPPIEATRQPDIAASPLASRIAAEHNVDLSQVKSAGKRIQKVDVLAYLQNNEHAPSTKMPARLTMASPKARRLAGELAPLLLPRGVSVQSEYELTHLPRPVPAPALYAKDRHHARHHTLQQLHARREGVCQKRCDSKYDDRPGNMS